MLNDIVLFLLSEVVGWCELRLKGAILLWIRRVVRLRMKLQRKQSGDCLFQWKNCTCTVPPMCSRQKMAKNRQKMAKKGHAVHTATSLPKQPKTL